MAAIWPSRPILFKFYSKFWNIKKMVFPGEEVNMSKNTEAIICFQLFSHQFCDRSYGSLIFPPILRSFLWQLILFPTNFPIVPMAAIRYSFPILIKFNSKFNYSRSILIKLNSKFKTNYNVISKRRRLYVKIMLFPSVGYYM